MKLNDPAMMVATVCGVGLLPKAPGTWGSLAALPLAWLLHGLAGPLAVLLAALALTVTLSRATNPLERTEEFAGRSPWQVAETLLARGRYGEIAARMIWEYPLTGVGVGTYHWLAPDYLRTTFNQELPFDNAQNWYRHQLAELGLVGSIPWILWVIFFTGFLLRTHSEGEQRFPAAVAKGTLVAFGIASLLGVPAQSPVVTLTFWTLAFWYIQLAGGPRPHAVTTGPAVSKRLAWSAVIVMVAVHATGTLQVARGDLRVPYRSTRWCRRTPCNQRWHCR